MSKCGSVPVSADTLRWIRLRCLAQHRRRTQRHDLPVTSRPIPLHCYNVQRFIAHRRGAQVSPQGSRS